MSVNDDLCSVLYRIRWMMKKPMSKYLHFLFSMSVLSVLLFSVCCNDVNSPGIPDISIGLLRAAPDTIELAGHRLILETYLWRDFMPLAPPDGDPLIALVRLVEVDSNSIEGLFDVEYIWVVNNDLVWASRFSDGLRPPHPDYILEHIARDGPKWGPGIEVDVVVSVTCGQSPLVLLAAPDQMIGRTD